MKIVKRADVDCSKGKNVSLELMDIHFDKAGGFTWSGEFKVPADHIEGDSAGNISSRPPCCFLIKIRKNEEASVSCISFGSEGDRMRNSATLETMECEKNVKDGCYEDLLPLLEEYFWGGILNSSGSQKDVVAYIKDNDLEKAVSSYLQGIIAAYSDSYLRNRGVIEELSSSSGYHFSQNRYDICAGDEKFKWAADTEKTLFNMRDFALKLSERNIGGDKEKYFLLKMDSLQKDFPGVLREFEWRIAPEKKPGYMFATVKADYPKSFIRSFNELKEQIGNVSITADEKRKLEEYEKKMYTGEISKPERDVYGALVSRIEVRYENCLMSMQFLYDAYSRHGLSDSAVKREVAIGKYLWDAKKKLEDLKKVRQGSRSSETAYTEKYILESGIDSLLSVYTSVGKDGRESEMTGLDRCKQAVLDKAEAIEAINDDGLKKKQYELFAEDVKALREIQYIIGIVCGKSTALLCGLEDEKRRTFFGENIQYLTADRFFAKIEEMLAPLSDGYGTEERVDFIIRRNDMLEDIGRKISGDAKCKDDVKRNLERVLGEKMGKSLFGDAGVEEIFLQENGDIDIKKLAEARKSILHALEEIWDLSASVRKASGEVKYVLDDSLIQEAKNDDGMKNSLCEKLLVIEGQILVDRSAEKEGTTAVYRGTETAENGSFGEVSDFLSTSAYLNKIYSRINGGSPGTGSFENTGYSDAGGAGETGLLGKIGGFFKKMM